MLVFFRLSLFLSLLIIPSLISRPISCILMLFNGVVYCSCLSKICCFCVSSRFVVRCFQVGSVLLSCCFSFFCCCCHFLFEFSNTDTFICSFLVGNQHFNCGGNAAPETAEAPRRNGATTNSTAGDVVPSGDVSRAEPEHCRRALHLFERRKAMLCFRYAF